MDSSVNSKCSTQSRTLSTSIRECIFKNGKLLSSVSVIVFNLKKIQDVQIHLDPKRSEEAWNLIIKADTMVPLVICLLPPAAVGYQPQLQTFSPHICFC